MFGTGPTPDDKPLIVRIESMFRMLVLQQKRDKTTGDNIESLKDQVVELAEWKARLPNSEELKNPIVGETDPVKLQVQDTTKLVQDIDIQ